MCLCGFIVHLTGLEKGLVRYSVSFPLRLSGEDRSLLETDLVCMNHSVGVCMCVILCVYIHTSDFACGCFSLAIDLSLFHRFSTSFTSFFYTLTSILFPKKPHMQASSCNLGLSWKVSSLSSSLIGSVTLKVAVKEEGNAHLWPHNGHPQKHLCII